METLRSRNMDVPAAAQFLLDLEQRQDEVLRGLEDLNTQVERMLAEYQSELKIYQPCAEPG